MPPLADTKKVRIFAVSNTVRLVQLVEHQIVVLGVVGSSPTSHPKASRKGGFFGAMWGVAPTIPLHPQGTVDRFPRNPFLSPTSKYLRPTLHLLQRYSCPLRRQRQHSHIVFACHYAAFFPSYPMLKTTSASPHRPRKAFCLRFALLSPAEDNVSTPTSSSQGKCGGGEEGLLFRHPRPDRGSHQMKETCQRMEHLPQKGGQMRETCQ